MSLQTRLSELATRVAAEIKNHLNDTSAAHAASSISYAGGTGISATNVEGAIDELATETTEALAVRHPILLLDIADPVPGGTPVNTVIVRF